MKLSYRDDYTPEGYQPKFFQDSPDGKSLLFQDGTATMTWTL